MKKIFEKLNKKILISMMIIFIMLSTFLVYVINAATIKNEMVSIGTGMANGELGAKGSLYQKDLTDRYDILCSSEGTFLASGLTGSYTEYIVESVNNATPMEAYILAEMVNDISGFTTSDIIFEKDGAGNKIEFTDVEKLNTFETITFNEQTIYVVKKQQVQNESGNISDKENGVGNEKLVMKDTDGKYYYVSTVSNSGYLSHMLYSYVQRAWWNTEAGGTGNAVPPNELSTEAEQFEAYLSQFGDYEYVERKITDENGKEKIVPVPDIEYKPNFNETNATVSWNDDEQVYLVGPFSINYIEAKSTSTGRPEVMFAGINNVELYTDASENPLVLGEDWNFVWQNRDVEDTSIYPHTNEEFYIKLKYNESATKITNLKFNFKYMNAAGKYEKLEGKEYFPIEGGFRERVSQSLAGGLIGARWYEETELNWAEELDRAPKTNSGKIKIVKNIVDESGNIISNLNSDNYFTFKITVGNETEYIKVKAGLYAYSKVYTWEEGKAPSYTVEEVDTAGYELVEIKNASGVLKPETQNEVVEVIATNKIINKGHLRIVKKITESTSQDQSFLINVNVSGNFVYQGTHYKDNTLTVPVTLTIPAGSTQAEISLRDFTWSIENAPKYEVQEDTNYNTAYELESINPKKGTLKNGEEISVTVINDKAEKELKLHIIKTLENAHLFTNEYIESLEFTFKIDVDGYGSNVITLQPIRQDNKYIWEYTSDNYIFKEGESLNYTIEEVNVPEGTEFVGANSSDTSINVSGTKVTGILADSNADLKVTNNIINKVKDPKTGSLKVTKKVNSDILTNKEYSFIVKVTGVFDYEGTHYENTTLEIPVKVNVLAGQTEASVELGQFSWYGDAPTYTVEEDMTRLFGVQSAINPEKGVLVNGSTINVIADNRVENKKGSLHIIKTLENASNFSNEYIKSLVFKFKITVGEVDYGIVSLKPQKINDTYIWEYRSDYTWNSTEPNPTYTIEEVELPVGTEFVSASSSNGTSSGMKVTGSLKPDSEEDYVIENKFINKLVLTSGYLKIQKKVTDPSLNGQIFKFNAKIKGTFEYNGTTYTNTTLELNNVEISGGSTWTSAQIRWYGGDAPTYVVEEQKSDISKIESVINASGTLVAGGIAEAQVATFTNSAKTLSSNIQITKRLDDGATSDEIFYFDIQVEGYEKYTVGIKAGETYRSEQFKWQAGKEAPKYTITEKASNTAEFVSISNGVETSKNRTISGTLKENQIINLVCINKLESHTGKLKVEKQISVDEKLKQEAIDTEFTISVLISGTFEMNGESVVDSTRTITEKLRAGESFETPEIKWYGEKAPTYKVTEINIPKGWKLENISNAEGQLFKDKTSESVVKNLLSSRVELDLTIELAGHVWEDIKVENKEQEQVQTYGTQGIYDEQLEQGIGGVEVYIYEVIYDSNNKELYRELGKAYEEDSNNLLSFPLYTDNGGYWSSQRMSVPVLTAEEKEKGYKASYDVEFIYDGQTYEPTTFLKTSNGDANAYRAATTSKRDEWAKDSMALDYNRQEVNNRIAQVLGNQEIDGQGKTIGKVKDNQGNETAIYYESVDYTEGFNSARKVSELQTKDSEGNIYDIYKAKARTSVGGLTYPFDSKYNLDSVDKYIDELGIVERYKYTATYNYTLNINLGLLKRETADMGTTKDLYSAKVIANGKLLNYKFDSLADLMGTTISRQLKADEMNINYSLGLYNTDYYYRAELYQTEGTVYDAIENFYKTLGVDVKSTELEVYLTYKIKVYNQSPNYLVGINSINDYFDNSFELVTNAESKYVETIDGVAVEGLTEVANKSYVQLSSGNKFDVNWQLAEQNIKGSDGVTYNKMVADFGRNDITLASGEKAEFTVTFRVQKDDIEGVKDAIILGEKANVAEIANYTTYYQNGNLAGKIDGNSAPANINIKEYNEKSWYEDDTDSAPILNLSITSEERQIEGIAWEDKQDTELEYNQKVGNGVYDDGEALIGGLTTQLVEKVMVKNPGSQTEYTEYDFVWPTNRPLDVLGGRTLESLTGFDSTIETSRKQAVEGDEKGLDLGEYRFEGVPAGNYIVRFLYGNDKTELEDSEGITADPEALKLDSLGNVVPYSYNERVKTANYEGKEEGRTPAVYNGHDYKSTTYQSGVSNIGADGYLNNEWHDLNVDGKLSDARDNESRRLETIAKSTTITNVNGTILATANDIDANRTQLYNDYYMFADTAKINISLEDLKTSEIVGTETLPNTNIPRGIEVKTVIGTILRGGSVQTNTFTYKVKNIDLGLEERSETNIVLDKQISSIVLTTSDGRKIFEAIYDISYEEISAAEYALGKYTKIAEKDGKYIVAKVTLNSNSLATDVLQAINKHEDKDKFEGTQNFRFINIDDTILQGCMVGVNYQITAINVSEVDKVDSKLQNMKQTAIANGTTLETELLKAAEEIQRNNVTYTKPVGALNYNDNTKVGTYLGKTYYQGRNASSGDVISTITVRQVIDYVDNDLVFDASQNNSVDGSWRNATINEITGNGFEENRLISDEIIKENTIQDESGVYYITSQKNNLILSVDSTQDTETLTNKGFESELLPYVVDNSRAASKITLKTSRTIAAESDSNNLAFDNLAEIVKYEVSTGRRDISSIPGNANPMEGEFATSLKERDTSATELITLIPPTGISVKGQLTIQILMVIAVALGIMVVGIIIIKKKVIAK